MKEPRCRSSSDERPENTSSQVLSKASEAGRPGNETEIELRTQRGSYRSSQSVAVVVATFFGDLWHRNRRRLRLQHCGGGDYWIVDVVYETAIIVCPCSPQQP